MKAIKDKIVFIDYPSHFSQKGNIFLFQEISSLKESIKTRDIKGIYINIKNVHIPKLSLREFIKTLDSISQTINCEIALGEYRSRAFEPLREMSKNTSIKLFKTKEIAKLFFNPKLFTKKLKVLLFDDGDEYEIDKQATYLSRFEHNVLYTNDQNDFELKLKSQIVDFSISQTKLNQDLQAKQENKIPFNLNKKTISNLQTFLDTAMENITMLTELDPKKISHSIAAFRDDIDDDIISSIMKFRGDLEGNFVLIFPSDLAKIAVDKMLNEDAGSLSNVRDGIGEFCNIITGSTKVKFQKQSINVLFELPSTYKSLESTKKALPNAKGIWINMQIQESPFYIFIVA